MVVVNVLDSEVCVNAILIVQIFLDEEKIEMTLKEWGREIPKGGKSR